MAGLRRWVRAPRPWRPSKLRLEVEAQRLPEPTRSGFMPRHIEQPDSRHWNPASTKIRSSPSASAWRLMRVEPGETIASTRAATLRPFTTAAAARRSSMRPLVQEPMKTLSTSTSVIRVPGASPMYSSARAVAARFASSGASAGSGTVPVIGTTSSGLVPQVTCGAMSAASTRTSRSWTAPASDARVRQ